MTGTSRGLGGLGGGHRLVAASSSWGRYVPYNRYSGRPSLVMWANPFSILLLFGLLSKHSLPCDCMLSRGFCFCVFIMFFVLFRLQLRAMITKPPGWYWAEIYRWYNRLAWLVFRNWDYFAWDDNGVTICLHIAINIWNRMLYQSLFLSSYRSIV